MFSACSLVALLPARSRRPSVLAAMLISALALANVPWSGAAAQTRGPQHGQSMYGELKYGPDFTHFDYTNPDAPKGGSVVMASLGTFDNLNPFILKGVPAANAAGIYDTLTVNSLDEPFSVYGLLAESIEVPEDKRWVTFRLRPQARWHDGVALTAEDVVWTFDTIKEKGHPLYKAYWAAVVKAEALDSHTVKFSFSEGNNSELPLIIGQLPIMPKHFWAERDFESTTLEPLLGSGPYRFGKIEPGRSIQYKRVEDYWGADVPVNKGQHNFDTLRYDYYRDQTVALESLKSGDVDFRLESTAKNWATGYDFPAVRDGRVIKEELPDNSIAPMQVFAFNTRLEKFSDARVREALGLAFDFEWMNKNLFYGAYERLTSYFQNSEMMATGLPEGDELELLEPFRDQLPASVFDTVYEPPKTDGSGNLRPQYRQALKLLKQAGWEVQGGKLTNVATGEKMTIEMIIRQPNIEKLGLALKKTLQRLGVDLSVRVIDTSQYVKRMDDFDFEMTTAVFPQTNSPGNEQKDFWSSEAADIPGSRNVLGIKNPVVDALIGKIIEAPTREALVAACKALDRVLLHNHYAIPQYFGATYRLAYWNKLQHPGVIPDNALGFATWWVDADKEAALKR